MTSVPGFETTCPRSRYSCRAFATRTLFGAHRFCRRPARTTGRDPWHRGRGDLRVAAEWCEQQRQLRYRRAHRPAGEAATARGVLVGDAELLCRARYSGQARTSVRPTRCARPPAHGDHQRGPRETVFPGRRSDRQAHRLRRQRENTPLARDRRRGRRRARSWSRSRRRAAAIHALCATRHRGILYRRARCGRFIRRSGRGPRRGRGRRSRTAGLQRDDDDQRCGRPTRATAGWPASPWPCSHSRPLRWRASASTASWPTQCANGFAKSAFGWQWARHRRKCCVCSFATGCGFSPAASPSESRSPCRLRGCCAIWCLA